MLHKPLKMICAVSFVIMHLYSQPVSLYVSFASCISVRDGRRARLKDNERCKYQFTLHIKSMSLHVLTPIDRHALCCAAQSTASMRTHPVAHASLAHSSDSNNTVLLLGCGYSSLALARVLKAQPTPWHITATYRGKRPQLEHEGGCIERAVQFDPTRCQQGTTAARRVRIIMEGRHPHYQPFSHWLVKQFEGGYGSGSLA